ncbi:MAG: PqqD family protein [Clostridiales bacterium]|nr:PqqD family protein [Clostridiales bacterium]
MKIKDGFVLREVAGQRIVVAVGKATQSFNGIIKLNESSALLWKKLEDGATEEELVGVLLGEYDVTEEEARKDVKTFVDNLTKAGLVK